MNKKTYRFIKIKKLGLVLYILILIYYSTVLGISFAKESYIENRVDYISKYCLQCSEVPFPQ